MVVSDSTGKIVLANTAMTTVFGYTPPELIGKQLAVLLRAPPSGETGSIGIRKDGACFTAEIERSELATVLGPCRITSIRDVSERERMQRELRASEEKFRYVFENALVGNIILTKSGDYKDVNAAFCKMLGRTADEIRGHSWREFTFPEDIAEIDARGQDVAARGSGGYLIERRYRLKDGSTLWAEVGIQARRDPTGEVELIASVVDITTRKLADETLKAKNLDLERALKVKDTFLSSLSHELRTPLTTVIGYAGTLLEKLPGPLTPEQEKQISVMRSSANRLLTMIGDLLDLAQVESGPIHLRHESLVCQQVVEELVPNFKTLAEKKGLCFEVEMPAEPVMLTTDRHVLDHVLGSFLKNAITFTDKGFVRLTISRNGEVRLSVADSGIGIGEEKRGNVFQAFGRLTTERNPEEGTGLGLHLSQKLARLVGGEVSFESAEGKGSTFTLTLQGA